MHRIDWRVATAVASVGVILVVLGIVVLGGDDDGQDEVVQAGATDAVVEQELEADGEAADQAIEPEPEASTSESAAAAAPTATPPPTAIPTATAAPEPTATAEPEPTATPEPTEAPAPTPEPTEAPVQDAVHPIPGEGCVVFIHGAGWSGAPYTEDWGDKTFIWPYSGNDEFPHFWLYDGPYLTYGDDDTAYDAAVANIRTSIDANNCGPVMITGASNGGAFLAKMYCRGEDFGGRLWAVHVDDPVPDAGVLNCTPSPTVIRTMFTHSTQLVEEAAALPGGICSATTSMYGSWYCEDDRALTLAEYEAAIGEASILSRAEHSGRASAETDFWQFVTPWFHEYDPDRFSAIPN